MVDSEAEVASDIVHLADTAEEDEEGSDDDFPTPWPGAPKASHLEAVPEFQRLREMGLHVRPHGCMLGVQPHQKVWRGYGGDSVHYARTWGGATKKRSCWQALLIVMQLLLMNFGVQTPYAICIEGRAQELCVLTLRPEPETLEPESLSPRPKPPSSTNLRAVPQNQGGRRALKVALIKGPVAPVEPLGPCIATLRPTYIPLGYMDS